MRIVMATETFLPHVDGIVTRLTQTITYLRKAGDEVLILAPWRPNAPADFEGAEILSIPSMALPMYRDVFLGSPLLPPSVVKRVLDFRPDLIHVASPAFTGTGPVLLALQHHIPLVASYHVQYPEYVAKYRLYPVIPFVRWYLKTIHNQARLNLATSLPMVRELRSRGFHHVEHWHPGVDSVTFHPARKDPAMRSRLSAGHPEDFLIITVARLAVEKELHRLIPVMKLLPNARLALVGDGPARKELEAGFAGLPVTFMGMIKDKQELASMYASADVFVLPSSTETLGLVANEAMASGIPAIVANRGGLPDLVVDGQTGYLFDPDDPADLPAHLMALQQDHTLLELMGQTARQHAELMSWSKTTRQLRRYYAYVLGISLPEEIALGRTPEEIVE